MGVGVGVAQLVGNSVQEEIPSLRVQIHSDFLDEVHEAAVGDAAHVWAVALVSDQLYGLGVHIPAHTVRYLDLSVLILTSPGH